MYFYKTIHTKNVSRMCEWDEVVNSVTVSAEILQSTINTSDFALASCCCHDTAGSTRPHAFLCSKAQELL